VKTIIIYILALVLLTAFIWGQVYSAQFLRYDDNFGQLIMTFLASTAILITGIIMIAKKIFVVRTNLILSVVFLIINSPLTVFLVVMNYEVIFGRNLDVG
jgi:hypothetical protein